MARALTSPNEIWIEFLLIFYGITPPSACLPRNDPITAESCGSLYRQTPPTGKPKNRLLGQVRDSQHKIGQHTMDSVGDPSGRKAVSCRAATAQERAATPRSDRASPSLSEQSSVDILTFGSR